MKACIFALFAVVLLNAQSQPGRSSIGLPSRTVGHFDQLKDKMPVGVDDGAKGGPAQAFTIEVGGPTDFFANLDSDVAVGRLTLVPSGSSGVSKANGPVATLHKRLQKGSYTLWVGGRPEASGAFVLQVAADQPPTSEMRLFPGIQVQVMDGSKQAEFNSAMARVGVEAFTVTTGVQFGLQLIKTFQLKDITEAPSSSTSTSNPGAAIMLGPAFGTSSHQNWVTVKTASDYLVMNVPAGSLQLLQAELDRARKAVK